jgi:hypothetical protein
LFLFSCPEYPLSSGSECTLIADPRDPTCCEIRVCGLKNGTSGTNSPNPTPARVPPAKYQGIATNFNGNIYLHDIFIFVCAILS